MFSIIQTVAKDLSKDYRLWIFCLVAGIGTFAGHYNQGIYGSRALGILSISSFFLEMVIFYWALVCARTRNGIDPDRTAVGMFLSIYSFRLKLLLLASPLIGLFFYTDGFERVTEAYTAYSLVDKENKISFTLLLIQAIWPWVLAFWFVMGLDFLGRSFVVARGKAKKALKDSILKLPKYALPLFGLLLVEFLFFFSDFLEVFIFPADQKRIWVTPLCLSLFLPLQYFLQIGGTIFLAKLIRSREQNSLN